jgi:hypothetical protein
MTSRHPTAVGGVSVTTGGGGTRGIICSCSARLVCLILLSVLINVREDSSAFAALTEVCEHTVDQGRQLGQMADGNPWHIGRLEIGGRLLGHPRRQVSTGAPLLLDHEDVRRTLPMLHKRQRLPVQRVEPIADGDFPEIGILC